MTEVEPYKKIIYYRFPLCIYRSLGNIGIIFLKPTEGNRK